MAEAIPGLGFGGAASEPWLMLQALALRGALPVLLHTLPLDGVLRVLDRALPVGGDGGHGREARFEAVERVTDRVTRELRLTRTACLKRALMRYALLRRAGMHPGFSIGVRPGGSDGFEAHAWVRLGNVPVMERDPLDYRPTFVWPATP